MLVQTNSHHVIIRILLLADRLSFRHIFDDIFRDIGKHPQRRGVISDEDPDTRSSGATNLDMHKRKMSNYCLPLTKLALVRLLSSSSKTSLRRVG
jgi:hypothetical protein